MKIKAFSSVVLGLILALTPLAAHATTPGIKDPGSIPIDEILKSEEPFKPVVKKVFDSGQILSSTEEQNLESILQKVGEKYGVEVMVEYLRTFPDADPQVWSADRAVQLGLNGFNRPSIYLNISIDDREFWTISNDKLTAIVTDAEIDDIFERYAIPEFKQERWVRGMAIQAENLARTYHRLPLFDTVTNVPQNSNAIPTPEVTSGVPGLQEDNRTEEQKAEDMASAQKKLNELKSGGSSSDDDSEISSAPPADNGAILAGFLWIVGGLLLIGVLVGVIVAITKVIQASAAKKRYALKVLEDKRIQRLVDQLVPRLRHSDEFLNATSESERLKIADKASFAVFGLKAVDKDTVLKMASDYVHKEKESGLPPAADAIDSTELMNLSIKALAEKNKPSK